MEVVFDGVPQQTKSDCGIFCIEFMRAFINGTTTTNGLSDQVSQSTMRVARQHILREIQERKIIEHKEPGIVGGKRQRKKSRSAM